MKDFNSDLARQFHELDRLNKPVKFNLVTEVICPMMAVSLLVITGGFLVMFGFKLGGLG